MTRDNWSKVLGLYKRLASALGNQVWVVAPDCVGDQVETLRRLVDYRHEIAELILMGARVMVPMQRSDYRSQVEFAALVDEIIGKKWVPAMPCKKAATSADEVREFVGGSQARARSPPRARHPQPPARRLPRGLRRDFGLAR